MKLLHLNIWKGRQLPEITQFMKENDIDIAHFQEVSKNVEESIQSLEQLQEHFPTYDTVFASALRLKDDAASYDGNATFFKKSLPKVAEDIVWLHPYSIVEDWHPRVWKDLGKNVVVVTLEIQGKQIAFLNTHLAWGETARDEEYKVTQGRILYEYVKTLKTPFILSGDFNVSADSEIVQMLNSTGRNLAIEQHVINTLNPRLHRAKHLFPPGLAVDFVYVSHDIEVKEFTVLDNLDLSDHYGMYLEFTLS